MASRKSIDWISRLEAVKYSRVKRKEYKKAAWFRQCSAETLMPLPALVSSYPKAQLQRKGLNGIWCHAQVTPLAEEWWKRNLCLELPGEKTAAL